MEHVLGYSRQGIDAGADFVTGASVARVRPRRGLVRAADRAGGHGGRPRENLRAVVVVLPFGDEEDAIRRANDWDYWLGSGL